MGDSPEWPRTLKYDAWNRLVEVRSTSNNNRIQVNAYDGLHRRVVRSDYDKANDTLSGSTHFYYNNRWQCVSETDGSGAVTAIYLHHAHYVDALAARITRMRSTFKSRRGLLYRLPIHEERIAVGWCNRLRQERKARH